jgi:predicted kinase
MQVDTNNMPNSLIVVFGLPGTGKTTFAKALAAHLNWPHFNTDVIRSELGKRQEYDEPTKAWVYAQLLERTATELEKGRGVVLDGTFYTEDLREACRNLAAHYKRPLRWIQVSASEDVIRERVSGPRPYSEADFQVYQKIRDRFEPMKEPALKLSSDAMQLPEMVVRAMKYLFQ